MRSEHRRVATLASATLATVVVIACAQRSPYARVPSIPGTGTTVTGGSGQLPGLIPGNPSHDTARIRGDTTCRGTQPGDTTEAPQPGGDPARPPSDTKRCPPRR